MGEYNMIWTILSIVYVISILLCGYYFYKLTLKELQINSGIINLGTLVIRIIVPLIPVINTSILIVLWVVYLYNTDIKINTKDKK